MTRRVRSPRLTAVLTLALAGSTLLAGASSCRRQSSSPQAAAATDAYPPEQPLEVYQQDPAWRHRVGILGAAAAPSPAPGGDAPPGADLGAQLEAAGFTVERLAGPPQDGGQYNAMLDVQAPAGEPPTYVIDARVLTPAAQGQYVGATEAEVAAAVVAGLTQFLKPTPPPAAVEEEAPPPPDPKEVCRSECEAKREPCARACCEKDLGSEPATCDAARDAAARCGKECDEKDPSKVASCKDACSRGKHSAYPWETKIARNGSVYFKCEATCGQDHDTCVAACDAPPAASEPAAGAAPAGPGAAPAAK